MKRVLLTGASGFIGRNTIAPLIAQGYEVHAVSSKKNDATQGVHWHCVDLLETRDTEHLMGDVRPTHLLHFAWYAEHGRFWYSSENYRWLEASIALLRHFDQAGGHRVVMAGTCAEYDWSYGYLTEAVTPCRPATPYGICKNALQELLRAYSDEQKLSSAWGRIFLSYGPGEDSRRLIPSLVDVFQGNRPPFEINATALRDFLHVDDVAAGFVNLLQADATGEYNICSGQPVQLAVVVNQIARLYGVDPSVILDLAVVREGEPQLLVGNNQKLRALGWRARHSSLDIA
ncbi:NAD(P)-dependent oxidoreductase [Pseudomonadales bacterium]|nr:NAD(P)-dependent oxidoreductase [Pseudomonadales bacterium]